MNKLFKLFTALGMLGMASQGNASGFALIDQSVSGMGTAYAGSAATAEDATTVWFNPAGMTKFNCQQYVIGAQPIFPSGHFHNEDSIVAPELGGEPLTGPRGSDFGVYGILASSYYVLPLGCGFTCGLALNSPFGLVTHYESTWQGRYYSRFAKGVCININPTIAYQICDNLSIGAGFSAQYFHNNFTQSIDFGSIIFAATLGAEGFPQALDGKARFKGNSWGFGGNVGLLWDVNSCTSVGITYRSAVKHTQKGKVTYNIPDAVPTEIASVFADTRGRSKLTLPQSASISAVHHVNCCWDVMGDITWTGWSSLKHLILKYDSAQPETVNTLKWKNVLRYSIGTTYRFWDCFKFRTGIAYDEGTARNKVLRAPIVPDTNRFWLSFGLGYDYTESLHLDFGYTHLFALKYKIDKREDLGLNEENFFKGEVRGNYRAHVDVVGVQVVYTF